VIARNPFRKYQSHRAGLSGDDQLCVVNIPRRVGEINVQLDGLRDHARAGWTQHSQTKRNRQTKNSKTR
jgi:hypothetical protein